MNPSIELRLIWQPVSLTETFCDMDCSANLVQLNILISHICTLIVHKKQICAQTHFACRFKEGKGDCHCKLNFCTWRGSNRKQSEIPADVKIRPDALASISLQTYRASSFFSATCMCSYYRKRCITFSSTLVFFEMQMF